MPALNFDRKFAADVKSGKKRQTIRAMWKRPIRIGDTLYHYVDQRSPKRAGKDKRLGVHKCRMVVDVSFSANGDIWVGGNWLSPPEAEYIALADGFESVGEMLEWFGLPFFGQLIIW